MQICGQNNNNQHMDKVSYRGAMLAPKKNGAFEFIETFETATRIQKSPRPRIKTRMKSRRASSALSALSAPAAFS
jgi:hypothetical protein